MRQSIGLRRRIQHIAALWKAAIVAILLAATGPAVAAETSPIEGKDVQSIVHLDGALWMRTADDALFSIRLSDGRWTTVAGSGIEDIAKGGGRLYLLSREKDRYLVETLTKGRRARLTAFRAPSDREPVMVAAKGRLVVVGTSAVTNTWGAQKPPTVQVYDERSRQWRMVSVSASEQTLETWDRRNFGYMAFDVSESGNDLYVGFYRGEWGGNLFRINLTTGLLTEVAGLAGEPVTEVTHSPTDPDCVLVATGLDHGFERGAVYRACGDEGLKIFEHRFNHAPDSGFTGISALIARVAGDKAGFWAASYTDYFRVEGGAEAATRKAKFTPFGGVLMDRTMPGLVLVKPKAAEPDSSHITVSLY